MAFTIRFSGAIQVQLARLYKPPVPPPWLVLTLALCSHITQLTQSFLNSKYELKKRWLSRHILCTEQRHAVSGFHAYSKKTQLLGVTTGLVNLIGHAECYEC